MLKKYLSCVISRQSQSQRRCASWELSQPRRLCRVSGHEPCGQGLGPLLHAQLSLNFILSKHKHAPSYPDLGPVIFLNASKYRCDALVVPPGSELVVHKQLLNTDYNEIADMQLQLNELLRLEGRVALRDGSERGARIRGMAPDDMFRSILSCLWEKVVSPILDVLPEPSVCETRVKETLMLIDG